MKKIRLLFSIINCIMFVSIITGCSIGAEEPKIDGGRDSTSYTYEQTITVLYYHDSEFQDSVFALVRKMTRLFQAIFIDLLIMTKNCF